MDDRDAESHALAGGLDAGDLEDDSLGEQRRLARSGVALDACSDSWIDRLRLQLRSKSIGENGLAARNLVMRLLAERSER